MASELRNMHYVKNREELKRIIQRSIITWTEKHDNEYLHEQSNKETNLVVIDVNDLIELP